MIITIFIQLLLFLFNWIFGFKYNVVSVFLGEIYLQIWIITFFFKRIWILTSREIVVSILLNFSYCNKHDLIDSFWIFFHHNLTSMKDYSIIMFYDLWSNCGTYFESIVAKRTVFCGVVSSNYFLLCWDFQMFGDVLPGLVFDQNFVIWEVQWLFSYFCLICLLKGLPISVLDVLFTQQQIWGVAYR